MDLGLLKSYYISCVILLANVIDVSRGQRPASEFFPGSPSMCGASDIVNADDVFEINDILSAEGRSDNERSKIHGYFDESSPSSRYDNLFSPPHSLTDSIGSDYEPFDEYIPSHQRYSSESFPNFEDNEDNNKVYSDSNFPGLENKFDPFFQREYIQGDDNFQSFMRNKFTGPYKNERRKFPEQASRIGAEPTRRFKRKDIISNLKGKVIEAKKKSSSSSHAYHRDTPSSLPKFVKHILDEKIKEIEDTTMQSVAQHDFHNKADLARPVISESYPLPQMLPSPNPQPLVEMIGNLGPDKVQQLKLLLDTIEKSQMSDKSIDYDVANTGSVMGNRRKAYDLYDTVPPISQEYNGIRYPPTYNLEEYMSPRKSFGNLKYRGGRRRNFNDERDDFYTLRDHGQRRRLRRKRDVFPKYPFDKLAEDKGWVSRTENLNDDETKLCRWSFVKGENCGELVVSIQYWIDGVRDCEKEYLFIREDESTKEGNRLCGGQEDVRPYVVEGQSVSIEHFRALTAGPGQTKFRGTIQCEQ